MFDIERLRKDVALGTRPLRITTHAQMEAFKDGLLLTDLRYVFDNGETVEIYPQEKRVLLFATPPEVNLPVHIVVEDTPTEGVIITAYVPDRRVWTADKRRKKGGKR